MILAMLAAHGLTLSVLARVVRTNKGLRDALEMRDILLGDDEPIGGLNYKDISPAVAAYSVTKMLNRAAPYLKLDEFGKIK